MFDQPDIEQFIYSIVPHTNIWNKTDLLWINTEIVSEEFSVYLFVDGPFLILSKQSAETNKLKTKNFE